jgi:arylsulfatase A-like enzyme
MSTVCQRNMYQGVLKVPLKIKYHYGWRVGRYPGKIILADLCSTILSICGFSIAQNISGNSFGTDLPVVSELYSKKFGEHSALYDGKYKYMTYSQKLDPELYDLEAAPKELNNLALELPEVLEELEGKLNDWKNKHQIKYDDDQKPSRSMDEEVLKNLKALDYIQ